MKTGFRHLEVTDCYIDKWFGRMTKSEKAGWNGLGRGLEPRGLEPANKEFPSNFTTKK
jgi:hypothetical protein